MSKITQCPTCQTRFKVSDAQLSVANGLVRCGRCAHIFNANDHLVAPLVVAPPAMPAAAPSPPPTQPRPLQPEAPVNIDDFELEVPDFDPLTASLAEPPLAPSPADSTQAPSSADIEAFQQALDAALKGPLPGKLIGTPFSELPQDEDLDQPPPTMGTRPAKASAPSEHSPVSSTHPAREPDVGITPEPMIEPVFDPEQLQSYNTEISSAAPLADEAPKPKRASRWWMTLSVLLLCLILLLVLIGQLIYVNRTLIASQAPETRPILERVCHKFGCTVPYPTDQEYLRTEWSELSFVPEHVNLVQLSATLKNHADYAQAYPMLEVTLKDANNQILIRRVFTPKEYLKVARRKATHFPADAEEKITMQFDVGNVHAQGYSLYWFYP